MCQPVHSHHRSADSKEEEYKGKVAPMLLLRQPDNFDQQSCLGKDVQADAKPDHDLLGNRHLLQHMDIIALA